MLRSVSVGEARTALLGAWRVLSVDDREDDASDWASYGEDPRGILIYHRTGVISVHVVSDGPASSAGYIGYWGTYTVAEATRRSEGFAGTLEHHVEGGSKPDLFEEGVERPFELVGDHLTIGDGRTFRREFERIAEPSQG
jgi:hypothetical protein